MPEDVKVKQGDCISSIAFKYGFFPDTIWKHDKNSQLKQDRKDPNVLTPGDTVHIPDKQVEEIDKPDQKRHRFRRKGVPEVLKIQFLRGDKPRANESFTFDLDGRLFNGVTDSEGHVTQAIPPDARKGLVRFSETNDEYKLELGHLDSIEELSGVQGRLRNLGYYGGAIDGQMNDDLVQAIQAFQASEDLEPDGELTQETKDALVRVYTA